MGKNAGLFYEKKTFLTGCCFKEHFFEVMNKEIWTCLPFIGLVFWFFLNSVLTEDV